MNLHLAFRLFYAFAYTAGGRAGGRKAGGTGGHVLLNREEASQSLPPAGGKENAIIFSGGMYGGKNTFQAASVEFVRHRRANYARSRL